MSASATTPNLGLPQWAAGDPIKDYVRDEFNAAFLAIDGAVIKESGSNANGKYVKFADGTMIQQGVIPTTAMVAGIIYPTITLPVAFYDTNGYAGASGHPATSWNGVYVQAVEFASVSAIQPIIHSDSIQDFTAGKWFAIGRWKA